MDDVNVGIVGLGNVGSGTVTILAENAEQIALKLGFNLRVKAVSSLDADTRQLPESLGPVERTLDWRRVATHPEVDIVVELVGGTTVAREILETAIDNKKSVVTANKELMALCGPDLWDRAIGAGVNVAMEASVAGGIPIHAVLREGISGDRLVALYGILNGTSNYILTEMEKHGDSLEKVLAEAQRLGFAEANPGADIDGWDARSKLALLAAHPQSALMHAEVIVMRRKMRRKKHNIHTIASRSCSFINLVYHAERCCCLRYTLSDVIIVYSGAARWVRAAISVV